MAAIGPSVRKGQALHRGDADAQARERAGAGGDGKHIDTGELASGPLQRRQQVSRQPFTLRSARGHRSARPAGVPSSSTATPPARVVVSSASTIIGASILPEIQRIQ